MASERSHWSWRYKDVLFCSLPWISFCHHWLNKKDHLPEMLWSAKGQHEFLCDGQGKPTGGHVTSSLAPLSQNGLGVKFCPCNLQCFSFLSCLWLWVCNTHSESIRQNHCMTNGFHDKQGQGGPFMGCLSIGDECWGCGFWEASLCGGTFCRLCEAAESVNCGLKTASIQTLHVCRHSVSFPCRPCALVELEFGYPCPVSLEPDVRFSVVLRFGKI